MRSWRAAARQRRFWRRLFRQRPAEFFCAQQARLAERAAQKIILQSQFTDLGVQRLQIDRRFGRSRPVLTEHAGGALQHWLLHVVIWLGCTSNCCANSASVLSPSMAAKATFALNAGECVRRLLFVIFSPDLRP
ncbi:hypothetical protein M2320_001500 [Rhodoblastus acidophilus]|nr:hypothetical protein [Rhodoblastus acidophilus]